MKFFIAISSFLLVCIFLISIVLAQAANRIELWAKKPDLTESKVKECSISGSGSCTQTYCCGSTADCTAREFGGHSGLAKSYYSTVLQSQSNGGVYASLFTVSCDPVDNLWGDGHQYKCDTDKTRLECSGGATGGCSYTDSNLCDDNNCGADAQCNNVAPYSNTPPTSWYTPEWQYVKSINISNSGPALTDYQISINIDANVLADLIAQGKIKSNLSDIRFIDMEGNVLSYWIEPYTITVASDTDDVEAVYADGNFLHSSNNWQVTTKSSINLTNYGGHTIALSANNSGGAAGHILTVYGPSGILFNTAQDNTWKYLHQSAQPSGNWKLFVYDDSAWSNEVVTATYGSVPWGTTPNFPDSSAQWLWYTSTAYSSADTTPMWIRRSFNISPIIWVKIPSIPSGNKTIFMYYGNPSATYDNFLGGNKTFIFFDDFSGSSIDTTKWFITDGTGWSIVNGELKGTSTTGRLTSIQNFSSNRTLEVKFRYISLPTNGYQIGGFFSSTTNSFGFLNHPTTDWYRNDGNWVQLGATSPSSTNLLTKITVKSSTQVDLSVKNYNSGANYQSASNIANSVSNEPVVLGRRYDNSYTGQSHESYWDWVLVRKYASTEPTTSIDIGELSYNQWQTGRYCNSTCKYDYLPIFIITSHNLTNSSDKSYSNKSFNPLVEWSPSLNYTSGHDFQEANFQAFNCDLCLKCNSSCSCPSTPEYLTNTSTLTYGFNIGVCQNCGNGWSKTIKNGQMIQSYQPFVPQKACYKLVWQIKGSESTETDYSLFGIDPLACGNGVTDPEENCINCPDDAGCLKNQICKPDGSCGTILPGGNCAINGVCEDGESCDCADCYNKQDGCVKCDVCDSTTQKCGCETEPDGCCPRDSYCTAIDPDCPFSSLTFSADINYFNLFWTAKHPRQKNEQVGVKCWFNCDPRDNPSCTSDCSFDGSRCPTQRCIPYPVLQLPGPGSCTVSNPRYSYEAGRDKILCVLYESTNPFSNRWY